VSDSPPPDLAAARRRAANLAYAHAIAFWVRADGAIRPHPPGERIDPPPSAFPTPHGHGRSAEAAGKP
jgi:hypothetical protein